MGEPNVQSDGKRKDIAINETELKWKPFKHRHLKKEIPAE